MVFSSLLFLFLFLPIVLLCYFLIPGSWRNAFLFVASIVFYSWGEGLYALLMVSSILINWLFGLVIATSRAHNLEKVLLWSVILLNLSPLLFFKYSYFLISVFNHCLHLLTIQISLNPALPHLPIGISFFTFQAISYLIDVYRGTSKPQKNIINMGLYISFFPQLIAGPIVRYHDIAREIVDRKVTAILFSEGINRFIIGLSKKVLLANPLGAMADRVFSLPGSDLSPTIAWLGIICYTLQIYYDFSGYSDMAIGLGRMFGFHFLENFNYPYISKSIREFWKRWHISLSNWFMDYLYIPLGGNRKGEIRTYCNLLTVFILCGLWHGASWNFLLWGGAHGVFMMLERSVVGRFLEKLPAILRHFYVLFFLVNAWVLFRIESISEITHFYSVMYCFNNTGTFISPIVQFLDREFFVILLAGIVIATPFQRGGLNLLLCGCFENGERTGHGKFYSIGQVVFLSFLFLYSWLQLASGAYNPFLYFRF